MLQSDDISLNSKLNKNGTVEIFIINNSSYLKIFSKNSKVQISKKKINSIMRQDCDANYTSVSCLRKVIDEGTDIRRRPIKILISFSILLNTDINSFFQEQKKISLIFTGVPDF